MPEISEDGMIRPSESQKRIIGHDEKVGYIGNEYQISPEIKEADKSERKNANYSADLLVAKIKALPSEENPSGVETQTEKSEIDLLPITNALNELIEIGKERSTNNNFTLRGYLKGAFRHPFELVQEKRALSVIEKTLPQLEQAIRGSKQDRIEAWKVVGKMASGFYENDDMRTYLKENGRTAEKLMDWAMGMVLQNKQSFVTDIEQCDHILESTTVKIFSSIVNKKYDFYNLQSNQSTKQAMLEIEELGARIFPSLEKHIETLQKSNEEEKGLLFDKYAVALYPMFSRKEDQGVARAFYQAWVNGSGGETAEHILSDLIYKAHGDKTAYAKIVREFGVDPDKFIDASKVIIDDTTDHQIKDLSAMRDLEATFPGAPKRLAEEYGILSFSRYPQEVLLKQLEQEKDLELPYGVVLQPREDWNGGFYGDKHWIGNFSQSLSEMGFGMRIFECDGKIDVVKKLIRLNKKYGDHQKIEFALIGGHGDASSLEFGQSPIKTLQAKDFSGEILKELKGFFVENPTIILQSCSTGKDYGIGESLSDMSNARVIAPDASTSLRSINVSRQSGELNFDVEYKPDKDGRNVLRMYESGDLVLGGDKNLRKEFDDLF